LSFGVTDAIVSLIPMMSETIGMQNSVAVVANIRDMILIGDIAKIMNQSIAAG
jgi:aromatic ring hydroxylase